MKKKNKELPHHFLRSEIEGLSRIFERNNQKYLLSYTSKHISMELKINFCSKTKTKRVCNIIAKAMASVTLQIKFYKPSLKS